MRVIRFLLVVVLAVAAAGVRAAAPAPVVGIDVTGVIGPASAEYVERAQGGPRLAGYAYAQTKNPAYAKRAAQGLSRRGGPLKPQLVPRPETLNAVHEAPFVSTNEASQWSLTAIEILALCADQLPNELPPPPPLEFGNRPPAPPPGNTPANSSPVPPNNSASSPPAEPPVEQ